MFVGGTRFVRMRKISDSWLPWGKTWATPYRILSGRKASHTAPSCQWAIIFRFK